MVHALPADHSLFADRTFNWYLNQPALDYDDDPGNIWFRIASFCGPDVGQERWEVSRNTPLFTDRIHAFLNKNAAFMGEVQLQASLMIFSCPPRYGRSGSGTVTEPSEF